MNGPATAPHGVSKLRFTEGCAIIQFVEERFSRLKEFMDPFHLGIFVKIAESVPFIRNCIVIEEGLQPHALDIKDPAEKLQNMDHLTGQPQALGNLSGKEPGFHSLFLLGKIPGCPPE